MNIFWIVVAIIGYFVVKGKLNEHIKEIQKWIKENKAKMDEWEKVPRIMDAYNKLTAKIKSADLDKKWSVWEIIDVISASVALLNIVKSYEEANK